MPQLVTNPYVNPWQSGITQTYGITQSYPGGAVGMPTVNGIIKVNGRDSALQYNLPPNSMSPALFDQNGKVFYVVSTDGTGTKSIEIFDFSPHVEEEPMTVNGAEFVSKEEFDNFTAKVNAALEAINEVHGPVQATTDAKQPSV